jgi:hypothetical protein
MKFYGLFMYLDGSLKGSGGIAPAKYFHQRGFASSVLANKSENLSFKEFQSNSFQGGDDEKPLGNIFHFQDGFLHIRILQRNGIIS